MEVKTAGKMMVVMCVTFRRERDRGRALCLFLISYGRFLYTGRQFEWREWGFSCSLSGDFT